MLPGPIFYLELTGIARRSRYYWLRVIYGLILLFFLWTTYRSSYSSFDQSRGGLSIDQLSIFGLRMFGTIGYVQFAAVVLLTPALVAGVIADESRRKTLHDLLASRLTSGEIVIGKLLARILTVAIFLALGIPVASLLTLFGGVDPLTVALVYLGTFTLLFFLASLSILISVYATKPRDAIVRTYIVLFGWFVLPPLLQSLARVVHGLAFLREPMDWVQDWADPLGFTSLIGPLTFSNPYYFILLKCLLQIVYGCLFAVWATVRLRPVFRRNSDRVVRSGRFGAWIRRFRMFRKPKCGNDPMLWKEMFCLRTSLRARILTLVTAMPIVAIAGFYGCWIGWEAFVEYQAYGYVGVPEVGREVGFQSRGNFQIFAQTVITISYVVGLLGLATAAATSFTSERERDTWISLIATPLTPWQMVRAKMLGSLASVRWMGIGALFVLLLALALGSIHPIGALLWLLEAAVFVWFTVALGTFFSLHAKTSTRALAQTMDVLLVINGVYMLCCFSSMSYGARSSPLSLSSCVPSIQYLTLFSGADQYWHQQASSPIWHFALFLIDPVIAYGCLALAVTLGLVGMFNKAADRPRRGKHSLEPPPLLLAAKKAKDLNSSK